MKARLFVAAVVSCVLFCILGTILGQAQSPEAGPALVPTGTPFTYQGRLVSGATPVQGTCDFVFELWDAETEGEQVGAAITQTGIIVDEGLFTTLLGFAHGSFNGDARWLSIAVRCPSGVAGFVQLEPRQMLTPVPYALALPGVQTRVEVTTTSVIAGHSENAVDPGIVGATVGGGGSLGHANRVAGMFGTVGGGQGNQALGNASTVAGGGGTYVDYKYMPYTIGNLAVGDWSTIGGGGANSASGFASTVAGGGGFEKAGLYWWEVLSIGNTAGGRWSTVSGGAGNEAASDLSTVGGGKYNHSLGVAATIAGGERITVTGLAASVAGGSHITVTGDYASVGGGQWNAATGYGSVVAGGGGSFHDEYQDLWYYQGNEASGKWSTVSGGSSNRADGLASVIGGGGGMYLEVSALAPVDYGNHAGGAFSTISGGAQNKTGEYGTVGGGVANHASGDGSVVAGGGGTFDKWDQIFCGNTASGDLATVGGGAANEASGYASVVSGGGGFLNPIHGYTKHFAGNLASGRFSTVGGGASNTASGDHAAVAGGVGNTASGFGATVGGGGTWGLDGDSYVPAGNTASGLLSTVPGGIANEARGDFSLAAGSGAKALHAGSFVWADAQQGAFASGAENQFAVRANGGVSVEVGSVTMLIHNATEVDPGGLSIRNSGRSNAELVSGAVGVTAFGRDYGASLKGLLGGVTAEAFCDLGAYTGPAYGIYGKAPACGVPLPYFRIGVRGEGMIGVSGQGATGVEGVGVDYGGYFTTTSGTGVLGSVSGNSFARAGVKGEATSPSGVGVLGTAHNIDYGGTGVKGEGDSYGVHGTSVSGQGGYFVSTSGTALSAVSTSGNLIEARIPGNRRFYVSNAGNVYADGIYTSPAADLAELLPGVGGLTPGDVLVIAPDGRLARCSAPYQASVAGVYSTQPAFVGGSTEDGWDPSKVPLAVVGVVPVKVTSAGGAIQPGDALTTSSVPGHAMKARDITLDGITFFPSGVILGKALEPWAEGEGTIDMLVILQ